MVALASCKKDADLVEVPPPVGNEVEVITTMTLLFSDDAGINPDVTATFRDPDGDGGLDYDIFDTIRLMNNTTYNTSILLLNETIIQPFHNIRFLGLLQKMSVHIFEALKLLPCEGREYFPSDQRN